MTEMPTEWTAEERLRIIALIATYIRNRYVLTGCYGEVGHPNGETIRLLATAPPEFINKYRDGLQDAINKLDQLHVPIFSASSQ